MQIYFEYSKFLIIVAVAIAAATSFLLYYKDKLFKELANWKIILMSSLRFVFVLIVLLLLLNPVFKSSGIEIQKPILVFVQDNSSSILLNKDSIYYQTQYKTDIDNLLEDLKTRFDLRYLQFDENVESEKDLNFQGQLTNISSIFSEVVARYSGMNLSAVILATDGIYNSGENPIYLTNINFPVYSIALGDTISQKDLILKDIIHNHVSFLGNKFPVRIFVSAEKCPEKESELIIRKNDKIVYQSKFELPQNSNIKTIDLELLADNVGNQQYSVELKALESEISYQNNFADFIINVVDNRNKILLLANSPHPDLGAIKSALKDNPDFELEVKYIESFDKNIKDYDLVVFHQLPSIKNTATNIFTELSKTTTPMLFIIGSNTSLLAFNALDKGLNIVVNSNKLDEAIPSYNSNFVAFAPGVDPSFYKNLSPLKVNFGDYKFTAESKVLLTQSVNGIKTNRPLLAFTEIGSSKIGFLTGEGIWKWRLDDFKQNYDHEAFNTLINKTFQYLLVKRVQDKLNVDYKQVYNENETVIINASFYDETFELVPNLELSLSLKNDKGKEFKFNFSNFGNSYRLDMARLPVGKYDFIVKTKFDNKNHEFFGQFLVKSINIEALVTSANHQILYQLAENTGAKVFYPSQIHNISREIQNNENIVDLAYKVEKNYNLSDIYLIFFIILLFATFEWILRKYWGAY